MDLNTPTTTTTSRANWSLLLLLYNKSLTLQGYSHITFMTIESSMAELGSNGFDPSHLRMVPSSSGSGPNDKRDVTESPLLSFVTCVQGREEGRNIRSSSTKDQIAQRSVTSLVSVPCLSHPHHQRSTHQSPLKGAIVLRPLNLRVWHRSVDDARQVVLHLGYELLRLNTNIYRERLHCGWEGTWKEKKVAN